MVMGMTEGMMGKCLHACGAGVLCLTLGVAFVSCLWFSGGVDDCLLDDYTRNEIE